MENISQYFIHFFDFSEKLFTDTVFDANQYYIVG